MRAVVTVIGKDMVGILAQVSAVCAQSNANIMDVTQSVMQDLFTMVMLVEIDKLTLEDTEFALKVGTIGDEMGLSVHVMHEDIFNAMHRI